MPARIIPLPNNSPPTIAPASGSTVALVTACTVSEVWQTAQTIMPRPAKLRHPTNRPNA